MVSLIGRRAKSTIIPPTMPGGLAPRFATTEPDSSSWRAVAAVAIETVRPGAARIVAACVLAVAVLGGCAADAGDPVKTNAAPLTIDDAMAACKAGAGSYDTADCIPDPDCEGQQLVVWLSPLGGQDVWAWVYGGTMAGDVVHVHTDVNKQAAYLCVDPAIVAPNEAFVPSLAANVVGTW
jgi:hypothetical protein